MYIKMASRGRTGLVDRASHSGSGDPGSILGWVGFVVSLSIYSPKVLVIPRNRWLRLYIKKKKMASLSRREILLATPFEAIPNLEPFRIKIILKRIILKDETKNI